MPPALGGDTRMKKKSAYQFHINPKFRAYGKARLDIAQRAKNEEEWDRLWKKPAHQFPFVWDGAWKQCIEYKVDDFAAEVGFFTDILGLPINALDPGYAMFTSPDGEFYFSVVPALEGELSTPPDAIRIQFMIADIQETALELERRGIPFELWPQACADGSSLYIGYFRTPHGICVDLWGNVNVAEEKVGGREIESDDSEGYQADSLDEGAYLSEFEGSVDDYSSQQQATAGLPQNQEPGEQNLETDEAIQFGELESTPVSRTYQAEEVFPPEDDESEEDPVELEYEYIDDDV